MKSEDGVPNDYIRDWDEARVREEDIFVVSAIGSN